MEQTNGSVKFEYSYSSQKQKEIEAIKEKYVAVSTQDDVLEQMKLLDRKVEKAASKQPIIFGSIGTLLLGLGMCGTMALTGNLFFILGIIIGVIGIAMIAVAYPLYAKNIKDERRKAAPEMLRLAEQSGK